MNTFRLGLADFRAARSAGEFVGGDRLFVEPGGAALIDRDVQNVLANFAGGGDGGGEIYLHAFEIDHRQADQHESGQQKKHDVDERNDLNSRFGIFGRQFGIQFDGHKFSHRDGFLGVGGFVQGPAAGEGFQIVAMMFGGFDQKLNVVDGSFQ